MARSNTLPISEPQRKGKSVARSATSASTSRTPTAPARSTTTLPQTSAKHHIAFPHPPIPHPHLSRNNDEAGNTNGKTTVAKELKRNGKEKMKHPPPSQTGRPDMFNRQNSVQTRYMDMLLHLDTIPRVHNILASFFTYVFPSPK